MNSNSSVSSSSQFSIKRLFWTMIVASVLFKLADLTGFLGLITDNWEYARGFGRAEIIASIIIFSLIAVIYMGWFGIRLPHLIEQHFEIRKLRDRRREEHRNEFDIFQK